MFAAPDGLTPLVSFPEFLTEEKMAASAANAVIVHPNEHSFLYIKHTVVSVVMRLLFSLHFLTLPLARPAPHSYRPSDGLWGMYTCIDLVCF